MLRWQTYVLDYRQQLRLGGTGFIPDYRQQLRLRGIGFMLGGEGCILGGWGCVVCYLGLNL